jgi:hypothetical protein
LAVGLAKRRQAQLYQSGEWSTGGSNDGHGSGKKKIGPHGNLAACVCVVWLFFFFFWTPLWGNQKNPKPHRRTRWNRYEDNITKNQPSIKNKLLDKRKSEDQAPQRPRAALQGRLLKSLPFFFVARGIGDVLFRSSFSCQTPNAIGSWTKGANTSATKQSKNSNRNSQIRESLPS